MVSTTAPINGADNNTGPSMCMHACARAIEMEGVYDEKDHSNNRALWKVEMPNNEEMPAQVIAVQARHRERFVVLTHQGSLAVLSAATDT